MMQLLTFLSICGGCGAFFALMLLFGGDVDDVDFDSGGHGGDGGGHDAGFDHEIGHADISHHVPGPPILSLRTALLFGTGFGAAGAIATIYGAGAMGSSLWGIGVGLVFGFLGWLMFWALYQQQSSTNTSEVSFAGSLGTVTVRIEPGGIGQVRTTGPRGNAVWFPAQSADGSAIHEGASVNIVRVVGGYATVRI